MTTRSRARAIGAASALLAVLLFSTGTTRAATQEDQVQEVVGEIFCVQPSEGSACYRGGAQTVTAGVSGELIAVDLFLNRRDLTTEDLTIQIRDGTPDGAVLASSDPIAAADLPVAPDADWILVTFPSPPAITAGAVFAIVIPDDPLFPTPDPSWGWGKASDDRYGGGVAFGGSGGNSWEPYVDGSDLAFRTYVQTAAATCELAGAVDGGDQVEGPLDVTVGSELELVGTDFPSLTEVTIELTPAGGQGDQVTDESNVLGEVGGVVTFDQADVGDWQIVASVSADPSCTDTLAVTVVAAPPNTTTPPRVTPPATSTVEPPLPGVTPGLLWLLASFGLFAGVVVVTASRLRR